MLQSKRGAAILQVLLLAAVLAGIATMVLRFSVGRTSSARMNRRIVAGKLAIESCMAEVNELWVTKSPEAFERDWNQCIFKCPSAPGLTNPNESCTETTSDAATTYICNATSYDNTPAHKVIARIALSDPDDPTSGCNITYTLPDVGSL